MADEVAARISGLQLDADYASDDEWPVFRSGADDAFAAWHVHSDVQAEAADGDVYDTWTEDTKRCVLPDADPLWSEISSLSKLEVVLKPHRTERREGGGAEHLVNSIRAFTVLVSLVDPSSDRAISGWRTTLRATLVYADTGEPVPAQRGEAPLGGELEKTLEGTGEACALRLRVSALSHHHERRAFVVRVEADELPGGRFGVAATSEPLRAVARLPNATATTQRGGSGAAPSAAPTAVATTQPSASVADAAAGTSTATVPPHSVPAPAAESDAAEEGHATATAHAQVAPLAPRPPSPPLARELTRLAASLAASAIVVDDDGTEDETGWENEMADDNSEPTTLWALPDDGGHSEVPVAGGARRLSWLCSPSSLGTQTSFSSDGGECARPDAADLGVGPRTTGFAANSVCRPRSQPPISQPPISQPPISQPATQPLDMPSEMVVTRDLLDELRAQGALLEAALAQQRQIMGEMHRLYTYVPPVRSA